MILDREDRLMQFVRSPSVAANNNTRLASGVSRRKNKLEGVVQKRIARIIAITLGLSRRKVHCATLHSRKVLIYTGGSVIKAGDALPSSHMDPRCVDIHNGLFLHSCVLQARYPVRSVHCRPSTSPVPPGRPLLFLVSFTLAGTHLYTGKEKDKKYLDG